MANTTIKNSTIFYHDWLKMFNKMSDADVGKICKALLLLDSEGIRTPFDDSLLLDVIFTQLSSTVERNRQKYDESCARKSQAAKKREAQKAQQTTIVHNCDDNDTDTDNDNVNDTVTDTVAAAGYRQTRPRSKNKFKNFDERVYPDELYRKLEEGG